MDILVRPYFIRPLNKNSMICSICNSKLKKEIKKLKVKKNVCSFCKSWRECGYCRYSDRPFVIGSSLLNNHYPEGCTSAKECNCVYEKFVYIFIICEKCVIPKCAICRDELKKHELFRYDHKTSLCEKCEKQKEEQLRKQKFTNLGKMVVLKINWNCMAQKNFAF